MLDTHTCTIYYSLPPVSPACAQTNTKSAVACTDCTAWPILTIVSEVEHVNKTFLLAEQPQAISCVHFVLSEISLLLPYLIRKLISQEYKL